MEIERRVNFTLELPGETVVLGVPVLCQSMRVTRMWVADETEGLVTVAVPAEWPVKKPSM